MKVQVLHVPECANADLLVQRLTVLIAGRSAVEQRVVREQGQAEAWGMTGSPTLLVDGIDPFPSEDRPPALACRIYRDDAGRPIGVPSLAQLRDILAAKGIIDA